MKHFSRPYIICHMMQTLDGKIASGIDGVEIIMDYFDLYTKVEKEFEVDAWMFGTKTGAAFAESIETTSFTQENIQNTQDYFADSLSKKFVIIPDTHGRLRWKQNYVELSNQTEKFSLIIIVSENTPATHLDYLKAKKISYVVNPAISNLSSVLEKLKTQFRIHKILLEGGGIFNGAMLAADLIDELSIILLPRVINKKDAPSLFDYTSDEIDPKDFSLNSIQKLDEDIIWLRYQRMYSSGKTI